MLFIHLLIYIFSLIGFSLVAVCVLNYIASSIELKKARMQDDERREANEKNKLAEEEFEKQVTIDLATSVEGDLDNIWEFNGDGNGVEYPYWVYHNPLYQRDLVQIDPSVKEDGKVQFEWEILLNDSFTYGITNTLKKAKEESLVALKEEARKVIDL